MSVNNLSPYLNRSSNSTYEMKSSCSPEKDALISKLKEQIFEREQTEKNYYQLQSKYRNLQNDLQLLSEEKLRMEYDLKQRTDNGSVSIGELKKDNEDILNELNEKIAMNKRLYNDNNNLFRSLESKSAENSSLKEQVEEQEDIIAKLSEEKSICERKLVSLNKTMDNRQIDIQEMNDEIVRLRQRNMDEVNEIRIKKEQNDSIILEIDEQRFENKNLIGKLNSREENLASIQHQIELANKSITKLDNEFKSLNMNYNRNQSELNGVKNNCAKENAIREQIEQNNNKLENMLRERTEEIKRLGNENQSIKVSLGNLGNDRSKLGGEIDQYRNHIKLLIEQNKILAEELEFILQRDQKLLVMLNRSQKLSYTVEQNNIVVENSLDKLKQCLDNKTPNPQDGRLSPRSNYQ